jgi:2-C-methyl-D-erythritol 4-phosphate cytidylyltransferase
MFEGKTVGAILLMAGVGQRFGSPVPKQFHLLAGKEVYRHTLETLTASHLFDEIILVAHPDWMDIAHEEARLVTGGKTRQESSYLGLKAFKKPVDIVLIHDAVRPFATQKILTENVAGAIRWGAVDTCIPTADTLVHAPSGSEIASIPNRAEYMRGQTPQTFRMDWIVQAHEKALSEGIENASDDCRLVLRMGKPVHIVLGNERNLKITSEFDLSIAEHLMVQGTFVS